MAQAEKEKPRRGYSIIEAIATVSEVGATCFRHAVWRAGGVYPSYQPRGLAIVLGSG
jgi:hypothetical protein